MRRGTMKISIVFNVLALLLQTADLSEDKRFILDDSESLAAIVNRLETRIDVLNSTLAILQTTHSKDVAELKATHSKDVAELKAAHTQEVADLKAGLNAEKLERCRTGSVCFYNVEHGDCSNRDCSESKDVVFSPPFTKVPVVTFAFSHLDISDSHNLRIDASVSGVTASSAKLKVRTWADTIIYESCLNWIACPNM